MANGLTGFYLVMFFTFLFERNVENYVDNYLMLPFVFSGMRRVKSGRLTSDWRRSTILTKTQKEGCVKLLFS